MSDIAQYGSASSQGYGGQLEVTIGLQGGKIVECSIDCANETPGIGGRAAKKIADKIVETGTIAVDDIAGATVTCHAIRMAAEEAFRKLNGANQALPVVKMKPGTYEASSLGFWGIWDLPVTITVNETALLHIEVPENRYDHAETEVILNSVKEKLFPRMIEHQSLQVDAIAGATVTSNSVKLSVEKALRKALKAGGSQENAIRFFYRPVEKQDADQTEDLSTDLLVVGLGMGGILAMRSAMETMQERDGKKRVSIIGIEKAGKIGGKSSLAHEFTAVNPPAYMAAVNEGKDFIDADRFLQEWLQYTTDAQGRQTAKEDLIRMFCRESGKTVDWLYDLGWSFGSMKRSSMTNGCVEFNSVITSHLDPGTFEDRRWIVNGYLKYLLSSVEAQGGSYMLETEAYELIVENGTVKGVKAQNLVTGKRYNIYAKAVILGTGGFDANDEMMTHLLDPRWAGPRKRLGTNMSDGKMIQSALAHGAGTWNMEMSPIVMHFGLEHRLNHYPYHMKEDTGGKNGALNLWTGRTDTWTLNDIPLGMGLSADSLAVTKEGERFTDESRLILFSNDPNGDSWCGSKAGTYYYSIFSQPQLEEIAQNGLNHVLKWDCYTARGSIPAHMPLPELFECLEQCIHEGMAWKADTIEDLAKQIGMDPDKLATTVNAYNTSAAQGNDVQFHKDASYLKPVAKGPFYAIQIFGYSFATAGGLDVDETIRVLSRDHRTPINGLYAIGCDSLGVLLNRERNYCGFGGVALGWALTAGRLAGINAAKYIDAAYGLADNGMQLSCNPDKKL